MDIKQLADLISLLSSVEEIQKQQVQEFYKIYLQDNLRMYDFYKEFITSDELKEMSCANPHNKQILVQSLLQADYEYRSINGCDIRKALCYNIIKHRMIDNYQDKIEDIFSENESRVNSDFDKKLMSLLNDFKKTSQIEIIDINSILLQFCIFKELVQHAIERCPHDEVIEILSYKTDSFLSKFKEEFVFNGETYILSPFSDTLQITHTILIDSHFNYNNAIIEDKHAQRVRCDFLEIFIDRQIQDIEALSQNVGEWNLYNINAGGMHVLSKILSKNVIKDLYINSVTNPFYMKDIFNSVNRYNKLTSLTIEGVKLGYHVYDIQYEELTKSFCDLFKGYACLDKLIFKNSTFEHGMLIMALDQLQQNTGLKSLGFENCRIDELPLYAMLAYPCSQNVDKTFEDLSKFLEFSMFKTRYTQTISHAVDWDSNCKKIMSEITSPYNPSDSSMIKDDNIEVTDALFYHMVDVIFKTKYHIDADGIIEHSIQYWLKEKYHQLFKDIDLESLSLPIDEGVLVTSFKKFVESEDPMSSSRADQFATYYHSLLRRGQDDELLEKCPEISNIMKWMLDEIYYARGLLVPSKCQVKGLSFNDNLLSEYSVAFIASILFVYEKLETLRLDNTTLDDTGAIALAAGLEQNTSIICLSLIGNKIQDIGATALAAALKINNTLKSLFLDNNKIKDLGATALAAILKQNMSLEELSLKDNDIDDDGFTALEESLQYNTTMKSLTLGEYFVCRESEHSPTSVRGVSAASHWVDVMGVETPETIVDTSVC